MHIQHTHPPTHTYRICLLANFRDSVRRVLLGIVVERLFASQMPFLLLNQSCHSTYGYYLTVQHKVNIVRFCEHIHYVALLNKMSNKT